MPLKKCNKCNQEKSLDDFYKNIRMKDGFNTFCILCHRLDSNIRKNKNRAIPEFKQKELVYKKLYREKTVMQRAAYMAQWRQENKEHLAKYDKEYRNNNKSRTNYWCQLRKISIMQRTPKWLTEDDLWMIEQAYELAAYREKIFGFKWHVDHIIPLRGKTVSGLHTPYNLQVIPATINQRKSNLYKVDNA